MIAATVRSKEVKGKVSHGDYLAGEFGHPCSRIVPCHVVF